LFASQSAKGEGRHYQWQNLFLRQALTQFAPNGLEFEMNTIYLSALIGALIFSVGYWLFVGDLTVQPLVIAAPLPG
jgi:hypothetical protein